MHQSITSIEISLLLNAVTSVNYITVVVSVDFPLAACTTMCNTNNLILYSIIHVVNSEKEVISPGII